ncbi:MAG: OmpA family protein [Candidatus Polarisedimenticolaceae bacterium]|nr:OmpA family protein [Candidatus Polarisedimenticolaceae bacterium]
MGCSKLNVKIASFALCVAFNMGLLGVAQAASQGEEAGNSACECKCWKDRWLTDEPRSVCILDSDRDGVIDSKDNCPGTPKGIKVDGNGCELDSDGDGVVDSKDNCPGTPKGAKVDQHGCQQKLDSDGDGVVDSKDKCPGTPRGAPVDRNGCELDSDGDGVVDRKDSCPETPAGVKVDRNGCAEPIVLKGVNFENDSAVLTAQAKSILNGVANSLKKRPDIKVTIAGHTDSRGSAAYNKMLSQRRADSVRRYLASKGVKASSLIAKGFGEEQPIAINDTATGRADNRRVELRMQ